MEEVVGCHGHSNKENVIPPFSATTRAKLTNPVPGNGSSSKKCYKKMRLRRKPLADITNLYIYSDNNSVQSSLAHLPSPTLSFSSSNSKKRKSIREGDSTVQATKSNSKSLRMGFR
ncbi:unnamed protein product [Prunus brigantina]